MTPLQIGVCSWSIDRHDVRKAIATAREKLGLSVVQAGFFGPDIPSEATIPSLAEWIKDSGVEVAATLAGFEGEDYSSIAAIRKTGGYANDSTFDERFEATCRMRDLTAAIGAKLFAVHAGHVPQDPTDPRYKTMLDRVGRVADTLAKKNIALMMETGREPAEIVARFIADLDRQNVKVNFDPANVILYGAGDPVEALTRLRPHVANVHIKDATQSKNPGTDWGSEVLAGTGEADIPRVISKLRAGGYTGPLIIERELKPPGSLNEIRDTIDYLESLGL